MNDLIFSYSRAQAINDGVLIDVSKLAAEAGFLFPVAMTSAAWVRCVNVAEKAEESGQDETGRLWDVLNVLRWAVKRSPGGNEVRFQVSVFDGDRFDTVELKSLCGPGDDAEPVITIMLPDED
jgi:hypothetical protein